MSAAQNYRDVARTAIRDALAGLENATREERIRAVERAYPFPAKRGYCYNIWRIEVAAVFGRRRGQHRGIELSWHCPHCGLSGAVSAMPMMSAAELVAEIRRAHRQQTDSCPEDQRFRWSHAGFYGTNRKEGNSRV